MTTASLIIESAPNWLGHTNIYHLAAPLGGSDYVAVSVFDTRAFTLDGQPSEWHNAGVQVVGCDQFGCAPTLDVIHQSYVVDTHVDVLARLGYQLTEQD